MTIKNLQKTCPVCKSNNAKYFKNDKFREYFICSRCNAVFVPSEYFISAEDEKARYDLHQNTADNKGYIKFLERLLIPVSKLLSPQSEGLNFGSGPEPVLSNMFENAGYKMTNYDPFYSNGLENNTKQFDFIVSTEVVEHFYNPKKEFEKMWSLLKPGGVIGIMTKLTDGINDFSHWFYKNDQTHVCFYSKQTFIFIAEELKATVQFIEKDDIIILQRESF